VRDGALNLARDQARAEGRRRFVSALAAAFLVTGGIALGIHRENAEVREALMATHRAELAALKERFEAAVDTRAGGNWGRCAGLGPMPLRLTIPSSASGWSSQRGIPRT
jgi:hypothetical protein